MDNQPPFGPAPGPQDPNGQPINPQVQQQYAGTPNPTPVYQDANVPVGAFNSSLGTPMPSPIPQQDSNFVVQPPAPKKPGQGLIITLIVLAVLLIGAIGAVVYLAFFQPKATVTKTVTTSDVDQNNAAQVLVAKAQTAVTDALKTNYTDAVITKNTSAPVYKSDTYAVYGGNIGQGLSVDPTPGDYDQAGVTAAHRAIATLLEADKSYKKTTTAWKDTYQSDTVICDLTNTANPVVLSCANVADYKTAIAQVAPLAAAYFETNAGKANQTAGLTTAFSIPSFDEQANGYSNARTTISTTQNQSGAVSALFYAKDDNWSYWRSVTTTVPCSDYNTIDLQHSFEADVCWDAATNKSSVVTITLQ